MQEDQVCCLCENHLSDEEVDDPMTYDGELYCDECYREQFCEPCLGCDEDIEPDEEPLAVGKLFAVIDACAGVVPGIYRVVGWPVYFDGSIEVHLNKPNIQRVEDLPECWHNADGPPCWKLCSACQSSVAATLPAPGEPLPACTGVTP